MDHTPPREKIVVTRAEYCGPFSLLRTGNTCRGENMTEVADQRAGGAVTRAGDHYRPAREPINVNQIVMARVNEKNLLIQTRTAGKGAGSEGIGSRCRLGR